MSFDGGYGIVGVPKLAWKSFAGFHGGSKDHSDYWFPAILGAFELGAYPVLMVTNGWTAIGAWIGLKTIPQWSVWDKNRAAFNRFLIGNALTLVVSILALAPFVTVSDSR